ncbi:Coenzyme F420 hydrogenase/dehydrogenase, beta subunit C-terminal domain [Stutzerimonas stutzeri]|uniref:Coenzyme F420 hydrogenase/dehydrogenase, beta subunit C-terminal domain n=1 Tax=Stutzerimonas stutzeri TaxID=316 RepID=UPI002446ABE5|nr:Coenzyme F420 hydrogenase/dehydrogenase, beta subunit C-terminal domain [Stutzerimonas stutzeri]MDH0427971.1 Coenzyme F420 hydrogenase/dehydrogenase, beta subunit C-terminal domain [Stutzerimonas stutzeri]
MPLVVKDVVDHDLCIGCGVCVQACPNEAIEVAWNELGFLVAKGNGNPCDEDGSCIKVCPFNPSPAEDLKDENDLANIFLMDTKQAHEKIGRYTGIYAGYSKKFRQTSSSGGVATYVHEQLLKSGIIDHVVTVGSSEKPGVHYEYTIISSPEKLLSTSKTRYHPVTLENALKEIKSLNGKVAISGVGCFIKAIRLAQAHDPELKEKIAFLTGIICGGVKSRFFTEYLASKAGVKTGSAREPEYRVKDPASTASDYAFSCIDTESDSTKIIKMRTAGDMWGTGLFKANACDFCDDVTSELADISLGDAWLEPYSRDGQGHNVIVTRTSLANTILNQGLQKGELELEHLPVDRFLASQQGSFNHRHDGMATRIAFAHKAAGKVPPKRHDKFKLPLYLKLVQHARRTARERSLIIWRKHPNAADFDKKMSRTLFELKFLTKLSHLARKIKRMSTKIS